MKKLNLKWVSDVIGNEYLQWKKGDVVTIQAQTGTGKSYFCKTKLMESLELHQQMLILCNRIYLKRKLKIELLKNIKKPIPSSVEELDKMYKFGNVIIMSYQQIEAIRNYNSKVELDFKYIVCDECHYLYSDAAFNNKTDLSFSELVDKEHENSIKIFISATMEEIKPFINSNWNYNTNRDYSYVNPYYFKRIEDIALTIKNDISSDKWLVFVSKKKDAEKICDIIEDTKTYSFIDRNVKDNEDLKEIINNSKFNSDVLITTKVLDNGIDIKDAAVKNIVVMALDRVTFLQELGRIRIDINNPRNINLYMQARSKKTFSSLLHDYEKKLKLFKEHNTDYDAFHNKYYDKDFSKALLKIVCL